MNIPDYVTEALNKIKSSGNVAYLVGGCVRDSLMQKTPVDYDIAASSSPEETRQCFVDYKVIETGIKHGTVTVIVDGHPLEITTFREDGEYDDNRHPKSVVFTKSLTGDLKRRDFTVNAMAFSPDTGIVDISGGQDDIKNKIIRCVGEPSRRFEEDGLRIMRALRFSSVLDFDIDTATKAAIIDKKHLLKNISAERIFAEYKKLICGVRAEKIFIEYKCVFDELFACFGKINSSDGEYIKAVQGISKLNTAAEKTAALLLCFGYTAATEVLGAMRTDNRFRNTVLFLVQNAKCSFGTAGEVKRFAGKFGFEFADMLKNFRAALYSGDDMFAQELNKLDPKKGCYKISDLRLNGNQIVSMGITGKNTGKAMDALLYYVTEGYVKNTKQALTEFITNNIDKICSFEGTNKTL